MNEKDRKLIDDCGGKLTSLWDSEEITDKELDLMDKALKIMLHVLFPDNVNIIDDIKKIGLQPLGGNILDDRESNDNDFIFIFDNKTEGV